MIKYIDELKREELSGKKILLRVDFNIPLAQLSTFGYQLPAKIGEAFRIQSHKATVDHLLNSGAKVFLVSHIDKENSFAPIIEQLGVIFGHGINLINLPDFLTGNWKLETGNLFLLDNIRQDQREIQNDKKFALSLSKGFDFYVNDAFAVMHRNHASIVAITKHLQSYAGLLVKKETGNLEQAVKAPVDGKILVLGGAKISTKLPVIKNFIDKSEKILIGGAIANNFFKYQGIKVGRSLVDTDEENKIQLDLINLGSSQNPRWDQKIILPEDVLISDDKKGKSGAEPYPVKDIDPHRLILDIGPKTARHYAEIISGAEMVVWNGPMGLSEVDVFAEGTRTIAEAVASAERSVIGGGDTIAAVNKFGLLDRYGFVSTGGGAMLEFLAGKRLPGLESLGYY